jgi:hypothetical protein
VVSVTVRRQVHLLEHLRLSGGDVQHLDEPITQAHLDMAVALAARGLAGAQQQGLQAQHRRLRRVPGAAGVLLGHQPRQGAAGGSRMALALYQGQRRQGRRLDASAAAGAVKGGPRFLGLLPPYQPGILAQMLEGGEAVEVGGGRGAVGGQRQQGVAHQGEDVRIADALGGVGEEIIESLARGAGGCAAGEDRPGDVRRGGQSGLLGVGAAGDVVVQGVALGVPGAVGLAGAQEPASRALDEGRAVA